MGVAILNPHDCLQKPFPSQPISIPQHPRRVQQNPRNPNPNRRRKRSPVGPSPNRSPPSRSTMTVPKNNNNLVMGQVKILKRGEDINTNKKVNNEQVSSEERKVVDDPAVLIGSVDRIGPNPDVVTAKIRFPINGFYAGSAFFVSPPPSSVPLPGFFNKKMEVQNDVAASNLRRILGLNLS